VKGTTNKMINTTESQRQLNKLGMELEAEKIKSQPPIKAEPFTEEGYYKDILESFNRNI
jgi:hypothetical protein